MKRIFIGSFLEPLVFRKNYIKIKKDFGGIISGKWVPEKNLHLTYRFLGNVSDIQLSSVKKSLSEFLNKDLDVDLELKGLGVFPSLENPRVFFVKVTNQEKLHYLYTEINIRLKNIGFESEVKKFVPHITLKRIKHTDRRLLIENIKKYENKILGHQHKIRVNVIESILTPQGAVYKIVE